MDEDRIAHPVEVAIKNWGDAVKPPIVKKTVVKTYILDPTGVNGESKYQIAAYEPNRLRMVVQTIDGACAILTEKPINSPDSNSPTVAVQGRYLPASTANDREFLGPEVFWINALSASTRVTVTKEYC